MRASVDGTNQRISYKIRQAQVDQVPYMLVVGDKEAASGTVAVRGRAEGDLGPIPVPEMVRRLEGEIAAKS